MATPHALAVIGVGKIARDRHLPAIAADPAFHLVATVDPHASVDGVPNYASLGALLADGRSIDAVSICTPPAMRAPIVLAAFEAGLHVMIEKPPATSLAEVEAMRSVAGTRTFFAAWHSREAAGVAPARAWLADKRIERVTIEWRENIRHWHPGQDWILAEGGFGVFDPGINALSILTAILPERVDLTAASIEVPEGRQSPLAARLEMRSGAVPIVATFDFLQLGEQTWTIDVETDAGSLSLRDGGKVLVVDGKSETGVNAEYPRLYRRFAELIEAGGSDVDDAPLRLTLDALARATRNKVEPFSW
ncbi:Gfo/Idh/MocA family protein [Sphingomonas radiodurans]|uniref:Gfo/Idh/MocA family protein n=1 Tax=Sphingomonas radiodurans TaxID=2890321 RepID=UPI001E4554A8|nr:Gfo/Idh/MocA family oxidoreductase [Sphingomonas radiodurans]WBH18320.1 Gfo/Idh/MocA family oxidoreductase [Sphingomonas radiodurans]